MWQFTHFHDFYLPQDEEDEESESEEEDKTPEFLGRGQRAKAAIMTSRTRVSTCG